MEKRINRDSDIVIAGVDPMEKKTIVLSVIIVAVLVVGGVTAALLMGNKSERRAVYFVNVSPSNMEAWLAVNESDAYIAWEPFASSATVSGNGRILMWTGEIMPHHPCCVVVVSKQFLNSALGPELTKRFVKAHIEATEWMLNALSDHQSSNYTLLVNMAADFTHKSAAVVSEAMGHVEYGYEMNASFKSALEEFTNMYINDGWITNETFHNRGYTDVPQFVDEYVNESYVEAAGTVDPRPPYDVPIRLAFLKDDLHQMAQAVAMNATAFGSQSMFANYGLNVTLSLKSGYGAGGDVMTAIGLNEADFGYLGAPPSILKHINNNVETVIVAQANSEGSAIVVGANSDIHSLEDLIGRTIATPSVTSIQHLLLKVALERLDIELVKA